MSNINNAAYAAGDAAGKSVKFIKKVVTNKWFWIILITLIVIAIIHKKWKGPLSKDVGDYSSGKPKEISATRKTELETLARNVKQSFEDAGISDTVGWGNGREMALTSLLSLSDGELKYVSQYYRKGLKESLYTMVDDAWLYGTTKDSQLMDRLKELGEGY